MAIDLDIWIILLRFFASKVTLQIHLINWFHYVESMLLLEPDGAVHFTQPDKNNWFLSATVIWFQLIPHSTSKCTYLINAPPWCLRKLRVIFPTKMAIIDQFQIRNYKAEIVTYILLRAHQCVYYTECGMQIFICRFRCLSKQEWIWLSAMQGINW